MSRRTSPCRYLTLLDRFLEGIPPQDIEAITIPTLEEVSQTLGAQDALWVDRALASAPSECCVFFSRTPAVFLGKDSLILVFNIS